MVIVSRISLILFVSCMLIGIYLKKGKKVEYVIYSSLAFYGLFTICSIFIHPVIGIASVIFLIAMLSYIKADPNKLGVFCCYLLYGIVFIWSVLVILSVIESFIGRALF